LIEGKKVPVITPKEKEAILKATTGKTNLVKRSNYKEYPESGDLKF